MYKDISGIILSGGKSSRMGIDKALLKVGDETIIGRIMRLMKSVFNDVFIITNTTSEYEFLDLPLFEDIYKHKGPLSGIHSGLIHSQTEKNFIITCDVPLMSKEMINYMLDYKSDKLVKYCYASGRHHYLAGIYSKILLPEIEKLFLSGNMVTVEKEKHFSIVNLLKNVEAEIIHPENLPFYNDELFFNLNTPEDFEYLKKKI